MNNEQWSPSTVSNYGPNDFKNMKTNEIITQPAIGKSRGTICIDFDGVIHSYVQPWIDATTIPDPPVYGAFDFINRCIADGYTVAIHSSRSHQLGGTRAMKEWLKEHGFDPETVQFPQEKPPAVIYIDDRGFCFKGEWPTFQFLDTFRPWNRADDAK